MTDAFERLEQRLRSRVLSLKPPTVRVGVESWFPYYAGYSQEFVVETLLALGAKPGWNVLDPWNGAGTTTQVADAIGCNAIGFDLNPVAALVAAARLTRAADAQHSAGLAEELLSIATRTPTAVLTEDPLGEWLSPRLVRRYRSIEGAILDLLAARAGVRVSLNSVTPPPFAAFFLLCLVRAGKGLSRRKQSSNPTWVTPARRRDASASVLDKAFLQTVAQCAYDSTTQSLPTQPARPTASSVAIADARAIPLEGASIDAVVTSPPYCTRIDYFRATLFELAALGIGASSSQYGDLRRAAMGTNLMRACEQNSRSPHAEPVVDLLCRIAKHPSKASATYYSRSFQQYFTDAHQSLSELKRVLRPEATAVLVVQSSYYKDIPIPLGQLFEAMGENLGMKSQVVLSTRVRRVLATINPRATFHLKNRQYTEDVVALQLTR